VVLVAAAEALLTGVVMVVSPSLFCRLILGTELVASGPALGPLAGIAMLGTGFATWPTPRGANQPTRAIRALVAYNVLATIYLAYLGARGLYVGILLWPADALHAILSMLLVYAWIAQPGPNGSDFGRANTLSRSPSN
jgi:hypothetical protein